MTPPRWTDPTLEGGFRMKKWLCLLLCSAVLLSLLCACGRGEEEELAAQLAAYRAAKLEAYEEENARYADYEIDVAFLGDSLTDGYDLVAHYPQYAVANRGIGGETTFGLADRMQLSLYDLKPKVAVMLIGANNLSTMFENYEQILQGFRENLPNTEIILLSLTSMCLEWGKNNQLAAYNNVKIKLFAEKYDYAFVDLYSPLLDLNSGELRAAYTTDGGHLTEEGYAVLTREITPAIQAALAAWQAENEA